MVEDSADAGSSASSSLPASNSRQKRKASDEALGFPAQRLSTSTSSRPSSSPQSIDCRPIQDIYACSIKKGLQEVLNHLGCRFENRPLPSGLKFAIDPTSKDVITRFVPELFAYSPCLKRAAFNDLLEHYNAEAEESTVKLYYDKTKVKYSFDQTIYRGSVPHKSTRYLSVQFDRSLVHARHDKACTIPRIAVALVALAQRKQKETQKVPKKSLKEHKKPTSIKVHHITLVGAYYYFYKARIPSTLLDRLDHPRTSIVSEDFTIKYAKIPRGTTDSHIQCIHKLMSALFGSPTTSEEGNVV